MLNQQFLSGNGHFGKSVARAVPASYAYAHRKGILGAGNGLLGNAGIIERENQEISNEIKKEIIEPKIEMIAKVSFQAQQAYSRTIEPNLHGEENVTWVGLPENVKDQLKSGVQRIIDSMINGNYTHSEIEAIGSHNKWLSNKLKDGYKYGEIVDHEKKVHSNLLPFEDLKPEQQFKSVLFVEIVEIFYPRILSEVEEFLNNKYGNVTSQEEYRAASIVAGSEI